MATAKKRSPKKIATGTEWDRAVLAGIGAPATKTNLLFLDLWRRIEGGPADNPLNTSWNSRNVTGIVNSSGVKRYDSVQSGINATVATLKLPYYRKVVQLFKSGKASAPQLAEAVSSSPWDAGHYGAKKTPSGVYIGGNLVNLTLGPAIHKPGLGSFLGDVGHYTIHPGAGVDKTASAAASALDKPLKYILYGGAILGGFLLVITAFVLIAIGLTKGGGVKTVALGGMKLARLPKARHARRDEAHYRSRTYKRPARQEDLSPGPKPVYSTRVRKSRVKKPAPGEPGSTKLAKGDSIPF